MLFTGCMKVLLMIVTQGLGHIVIVNSEMGMFSLVLKTSVWKLPPFTFNCLNASHMATNALQRMKKHTGEDDKHA